MLFDIAAVLAGCVLLYFAGNALLDSAVRIGKGWGWSDSVIGLVLVSLGTSAPELFVSVGSALQGFGDMAAGSVIGSNTVNIALVLGLGSIVYPLTVNHSLRATQFPVMLLLSVMAAWLLSDGLFNRLDGVLVFAVLVAGLAMMFYREAGQVSVEPFENAGSSGRNALLLTAGIVGLLIGAELLILGGVGLSRDFGIPEAVIALTVTALGTSLPEIAATLIAVSRRHGDIAVGNVVGSNIMNIGLVLGVTGMLRPIETAGVGHTAIGAMLLFTGIICVLAYWPRRFVRGVGVMLLCLYGAYLVLLFS